MTIGPESSVLYPAVKGPRPARAPRANWILLDLVLGALIYQTLSELGFSSLIGPPGTGVVWWAVVGGLLGLTRLRVWPPILAVLCTGSMLLLGQTSLIEGPARRLVRSDPLPSTPVSAVVVLSGALTPTGLLQQAAGDRLLEGLQLLRAGAAPRLVISRVRTHGPSGIALVSDEDQQRFLHLLSPEPRVDVVEAASTRDEAVATAALARRESWGTVVVVTSPLHTRRACATFEAAGLTVVCRASLNRAYGLGRMTPGERILAFRDWVYETGADLSYRRKGWL